MSEPNDQLSGLDESIRRVAEDGLNVLLDSRRTVFGESGLVQWSQSHSGIDHGRISATNHILDLLATLPKGTSLCIK